MSKTTVRSPGVDRARELLEYDPATGSLRWRESWRKRRADQEAGSITKKGYRQVTIDGVTYRSHRIAWLIFYGEIPHGQIDHVNGIRCDNRIQNLREVDKGGNDQNRAVSVISSSGVVGVHSCGIPGIWRAVIKHNGVAYHLGRFKNIESAAAAYADAKRRLHTYHPEPVSRKVLPSMAHVRLAKISHASDAEA